jgi:hypothetical protein
VKVTPDTQQEVLGSSDAKERFALIMGIFGQTADRVKGGVSQRSERLTRFASCLIRLA